MPDWAGPVAHYVLHQGLPGTLHVGAIAVIGSALVGVVFGTLLTIDFLPSRSLIRLYIEVFRGLPILKANVPARFLASFSKNILRPNQTFQYPAPGAPSVDTVCQ